MRGAPEVTLLASLAVTYILENLGILIFTSSAKNFPVPDWMDNAIQLFDGQITFTQINIMTVVTTAISLRLSAGSSAAPMSGSACAPRRRIWVPPTWSGSTSTA